MRLTTVPATLRPYYRRGRSRAGLALGLTVTLAACGGGHKAAPTGSASASGTVSPTRSVPASPTTSATTPAPTPPPRTTPAASCVDRAIAAMSPAQRVGQLFMTVVSTSGLTAEQSTAISGSHAGGVFLMGHTSAGAGAVKAVTDQVRALAPAVRGATVRMLVSTDQEGGKVQVLNGPGFSAIPSAVTQGTWSTAKLQGEAAGWGGQLAAAGVNMNLAPVADTVPPDLVTVNEPIGKLDREYGTDPVTVATHSTAFLRGMQQAHVLPTVKHFPGLGRVLGNTDLSANVTDTVTTRDDPFLLPFRDGIRAGTPFVMVSLATYTGIDPEHQAVFSSAIMRGLLRGSLGFDGVIISDDLGQAVAVSDRTPAQRAVDFLAAGGTMVLTVKASTTIPMADAVLARLPQDAALRKAVDDDVRRVMLVKRDAGLLTC